MKTIITSIIIGLGIVAIIFVANKISLDKTPVTEDPETTEDSPEDISDPEEAENNISAYFMDLMFEIAIERVGQPIEGFEPFMLMQAFPNLEADDFQGVESAQGIYFIANGVIKYQRDADLEGFHSAERAITQEGMKTLLNSVSTRLDKKIQTESDINELIQILS